MPTLRERLIIDAQSLSTVELLAALGTGQASLDVATNMLTAFGSLNAIMRADLDTLCATAGLGRTHATRLKAALELGRRLAASPPATAYQVITPAQAARLVMEDMTYLDREQLRVLTLNTRKLVIDNRVLYQGTANSSVVRAAEIFRVAILRQCPNVIVIHNHPGGSPEPSPEDLSVTDQLRKAGEVLDVELVDHIIIGDHCFVSLRERMRW